MNEWKCPEGWRVKADDEIVEKGDWYCSRSNRDDYAPLNHLGDSVRRIRDSYLPPDSFVVTQKPLPANDTCLVWLAGKIDQAAKSHPEKADELRQQWFAAKSELASRMLSKIEALT